MSTITDNASVTITICSHLCVGENVKPFEPSEWSKLVVTLRDRNLQPKDLLSLSDSDFNDYFNNDTILSDRIKRLLDRSASITFEIEKYSNMGIKIVTRSDYDYPKKLKKTLKNHCPPLFYYAGELSVADRTFIGFVGSRNVNYDDIAFTQNIAKKVVQRGYGIVSGGAKGVDSISRDTALENDSYVIEYISDSLTKKIKDMQYINSIKTGKLLILSVAKPDAGFNTGLAMMRNKYIYAQSIGTVIVKSDFKKGGTWNGAIDNLKNNRCLTFCRDIDSYPGNAELIKNGAIAIDEHWDTDIMSYECINKPVEAASNQQMSLFN